MVDGSANTAPAPAILLNSNESAFGASPLARAAARAALADLERYMENPGATLAPVIAEAFGLDPDRIAVGQGSDDLLARLMRLYLGPGTELVRSANGYLKVPNYAHANDAEIVSIPDDAFVPNVDRFIAALSDKTRVVYLANPENPAGTYLPRDEVRRLHAALPDDVLLVIDAAYEEYVDAPDYEPAQKLVDEAQNAVMCRTFSKIYGLAGARVGWLYGPDDVVDAVHRVGLTFPVASASVAAAVAALEDAAHVRHVCEANRAARALFAKDMADLGLRTVPSQGNFMLVHFPEPGAGAEAADHFLRQRAIVVRRFASPAYAAYVRVTMGQPEDMRALRSSIADFLEGAR